MTQDEARTIKAMLLYILKSNCSHDVYSIVKTAYFAQQDHMARYMAPLFNDRIVAMKFGPVPSTIYDILKAARGDTSPQLFHPSWDMKAIVGSIGFENEEFSAKEDPDMDYLSPSAKECLDRAIGRVSGMDFDSIVSTTHNEEWKRAFHSADRTMDNTAIAREAGADEASLEYLKDTLDTLDLAK